MSIAPKNTARDATIISGGCAANAAVTDARRGGTARLAARVGVDPIGDMIISDFEAEPVDCTLVKRFEGKRSSFFFGSRRRAGRAADRNFRDETLSFEAG